MDQDEMLLFKEGGVFLEFHRWLKPSFTHGFFVNPEEEFVFSDEIDVARRATGGGIIYHGKDLSFALCFPDTHPFAHEDTMQVYDTLNRLMEQAILEVHSCAIGTESEGTFSFKEPFCMAKATKFDLTVGQKKSFGFCYKTQKRPYFIPLFPPIKKARI
jgi:lipoate-protein ligase A